MRLCHLWDYNATIGSFGNEWASREISFPARPRACMENFCNVVVYFVGKIVYR